MVDSLARKQLPHWDNEGRRVTLSAGVCAEIPIPSDGTLEELIARADTALYEAKRRGKNQYRIFHGEGPGATSHT